MIGRGQINQTWRSVATRAGLWLAVLALFAQSLVLAVPPMGGPRDARQASVELKALVGSSVIICTQADDSGAPPLPSSCDDRCPICQAGAGAFVFLAPAPILHEAPAVRLVGALAFPATPRAPPRGPILNALARGPPVLI